MMQAIFGGSSWDNHNDVKLLQLCFRMITKMTWNSCKMKQTWQKETRTSFYRFGSKRFLLLFGNEFSSTFDVTNFILNWIEKSHVEEVFRLMIFPGKSFLDDWRKLWLVLWLLIFVEIIFAGNLLFSILETTNFQLKLKVKFIFS